MTELTTIQTAEMLVYARRDQWWSTWVATADECQTRDMYRVKAMVASGFNPAKIVDIGAQTGMFSSMAGKYWPGAFIYCFEPVRAWFEVLVLNAPPNAMPVQACVLGNFDPEFPRAIDYTNSDELAWRAGKPGYAHRAVGVRAMMALAGGIDLLKIDCEGSEVNILREMDELGLLKDIQYIVGEYHWAPAKAEVKRILGQTHAVEMREENEIDFFWAERL